MKTPDSLVDVSITTGSYPDFELEINLARSLRNVLWESSACTLPVTGKLGPELCLSPTGSLPAGMQASTEFKIEDWAWPECRIIKICQVPCAGQWTLCVASNLLFVRLQGKTCSSSPFDEDRRNSAVANSNCSTASFCAREGSFNSSHHESRGPGSPGRQHLMQRRQNAATLSASLW
jgi:hypothetical protein